MKEFIINAGSQETRIALLEDKRLCELFIERHDNPSIVGNIYRGRVDSIVPGIQAAFIDIGFEKNGFLYVSDIAGDMGVGDMEFEDGAARATTRAKRARQQPIETILKKNQHIMVQVVKDRLGNKGARLTNFITMPGRYAVLMPTVSTLGVSRKIESSLERDRLKKILRQIRPKNIGLITRTAGEGHSKEDFQSDAQYLKTVWDRTKSKYERLKHPGLIREDLSPVLRVVRDRYTKDFDKFVIDDEAEYNRIVEFLDNFSPVLKKNVRLYKPKRPIFDKMGVEDEISKALRRKVFLKSGGHICIDQTEALIAIDVNTGKFTGKSQLEDTVLTTNLESAEEIARQVRLRDMGGIIVCDFIDMRYEKNKRKLLKTLSNALKYDPAKTTISEVSELGLIEMTRKRVKHNLVSALSQPCPYCEGSGLVRSITTVTFDTIRTLQSIFCQTKEKHIILQVHPDVARRLGAENKELVAEVAENHGREIQVEAMPEFHVHDFKVLRQRNKEAITLK
jgi:ribonuclease G